MEAQLFEWIGATLAIMALFGGGVKFILSRMDTRTLREREWEQLEREKLEVAFSARIETLERVVESQRDEMAFLRSEVTRHVRHVGILQGLLQAHDIDVPPFETVASRQVG